MGDLGSEHGAEEGRVKPPMPLAMWVRVFSESLRIPKNPGESLEPEALMFLLAQLSGNSVWSKCKQSKVKV